MKDMLQWAQEQIDVIEADDRYQAPPADVQVNAPLALIQMGMKGRMLVLLGLREEARERITMEWHRGEHAGTLPDALEMTADEWRERRRKRRKG